MWLILNFHKLGERLGSLQHVNHTEEQKRFFVFAPLKQTGKKITSRNQRNFPKASSSISIITKCNKALTVCKAEHPEARNRQL